MILTRVAKEVSFECANSVADKFAPALLFAFRDTFSDTKRAAGAALSLLCQVAPCQVHSRVVEFAKCIIANIAHQHVRTTRTQPHYETYYFRLKPAQQCLDLLSTPKSVLPS